MAIISVCDAMREYAPHTLTRIGLGPEQRNTDDLIASNEVGSLAEANGGEPGVRPRYITVSFLPPVPVRCYGPLRHRIQPLRDKSVPSFECRIRKSTVYRIRPQQRAHASHADRLESSHRNCMANNIAFVHNRKRWLQR